MDQLIESLKKKGFRRVSLDGVSKQKFVNEDYSLSITVEENQTELTAEQIQMIKKRMKDLGYSDE
jgi:hypothetical protein